MHEVEINLGGQVRPVKIELYEARWKRKRWPKARVVARADIELFDGIPIPGKGENGWDIEDDAIYGLVCKAATLEDAIAALRASYERSLNR